MGWKLEIFKMAVYITFPVALFHYFNHPANFEEYVYQEKKKFEQLRAVECQDQIDRELEELKRYYNMKQQEKLEQEYNKINA